MSSVSPVSGEQRAALERMRAGNARFARDVQSLESLSTQARRASLVDNQHPFAIVLSCSDARAPSELVFDCGLGDLFVVRVAGNVVAPSIVGSVEFAAAKFGTELVVVMGHTHCGAIEVTLDWLAGGGAPASENVRDIVDRIAPSIAELVSGRERDEQLRRAVTRANVRASANALRHGSRVLERRIADGKLLVVGAEYDLATGHVAFFDGVPA